MKELENLLDAANAFMVSQHIKRNPIGYALAVNIVQMIEEFVPDDNLGIYKDDTVGLFMTKIIKEEN